MILTIDTTAPLSHVDVHILHALLQGNPDPIVGQVIQEPTAPAAKPVPQKTPPAPKKATPPPVPQEEVPAPEPAASAPSAPSPDEAAEEDDAEDAPTMDDAVTRATVLVSQGKAAAVKAALAVAGAKRVSELKGTQIAAFLQAL